VGHVEEVPELHHALYAVVVSGGVDVQGEGVQDVTAPLVHPADLGAAEDVVVVDVEFYADEKNWCESENDQGEMIGNFLIRPDYGKSKLKVAGGEARKALAEIRKLRGDVE
jgi:hypothetical protein